MRFTKMHGIGNDFVMINAFNHSIDDKALSELAKKMSDRRFGIGSDGIIVAEKGDRAPFRMRMFNPDGSESEMCGNGVRCFARFLNACGLWDRPAMDVETGAGVLTLTINEDGQVRVDMGQAKLLRGEIGMTGDLTAPFVMQPVEAKGRTFLGTAVSMGNPHLVIFVDDVKQMDLEAFGPALEQHPLFPNRVNVHFVQVTGPGSIIQRTWERGAGITLACGTGACACAVAAHRNGLTGREVRVSLPGGQLYIEYMEDGRVFMTGPAETVFEGEWPS